MHTKQLHSILHHGSPTISCVPDLLVHSLLPASNTLIYQAISTKRKPGNVKRNIIIHKMLSSDNSKIGRISSSPRLLSLKNRKEKKERKSGGRWKRMY